MKWNLRPCYTLADLLTALVRTVIFPHGKPDTWKQWHYNYYRAAETLDGQKPSAKKARAMDIEPYW